MRIAERDRLGLLSIVADCLDRLLVVPNIPGEPEIYGLIVEDRPRSRPNVEARRARRQKATRPSRAS